MYTTLLLSDPRINNQELTFISQSSTDNDGAYEMYWKDDNDNNFKTIHNIYG